MANYGELIDDFNPHKEGVYIMFVNYFKNPSLVKVKDNDKHSMYACKLYCLLNKDCRYIIVFTDRDNSPIGTIETLNKLQWVSLQTRTLPDNYENIEVTHAYQPIIEGPLSAIIHKTNYTKQVSTYNCEDIPIIITLLHTQKNTVDTYQQKGNVILALETFETIITFLDSSFV